MKNSFYNQIDKALSNPQLQAALDANADKRRNARLEAFTSLPENLDTLRKNAHEIRQRTINNLHSILQQFTTQAASNGMIIHHAATANDALNIVKEIAQAKNARLVAKSKSMVSEEIGLNKALQDCGLTVVETDLGEYIVQLRDEPPAHIITPAVHLLRADVGKTFEEKLGIPYTDDVPTMTKIARRTLRQVFLQADIGVSGVNFGVAESGTLCLLTNEGNGRMVTTVPPVHIALMGVERLVSNMDELSLMLSLLPRSATGQKITVYTSLIHGPRRENEKDGPLERHLILIDNGRSAMIGTPLEEALLCIRCGACMNACPVFRDLGGHSYVSQTGRHSPYPGPIGSIISPALFGMEEFGHLARASTLCGACKEACPVDIDLPKLLLKVRSGHISASNAQRSTPNTPAALAAGIRMFSIAATNPNLFYFFQKSASWFAKSLNAGKEMIHLPSVTGWGHGKDFPRPAEKTFHKIGLEWMKTNPPTTNEHQDKSISSHQITDSQAKQVIIPNHQSVYRDRGELFDKFEREFTTLGGETISCSKSSLAMRILDVLDKYKVNQIYADFESDSPGGLPPGLLLELRASDITVSHQSDPDLKVGLTGAYSAAAETGSLLFVNSPETPMKTSLIPEVHLVVLSKDSIVPTLKELLQIPAIQNASAAAIVSGPSRTADIEMTLTIGVHGPVAIHVFTYQESD